MKMRMISLTLSLAILAACAPNPLTDAQKLYDTNDYQAALKQAHLELANDSTNAAIWKFAGDCYVKLDKLDSAIFAYEKSYSQNANEATEVQLSGVYIIVANKQVEDESYNAAFRNFQRVEELNDGMFDLYYQRGLAYLKISRLEKARADFEKALAISPDDLRPKQQLVEVEDRRLAARKYYEAGTSAYNKGKWISAISNLEKAIALDARDDDIRYMLHMAKGHRLYKKGSVSALWDGISELGFATQIRPEAAEPWYMMGLCYEKKDRNDFVSAIEPYEKAISLAPDSDMAKDAKKRIEKLNSIRIKREKFFGKGKN